MIEKAQTTPGFRLPTLAIHSAITKDAVKIHELKNKGVKYVAFVKYIF